MTAGGSIITLSLTGTAAVAAGWLLMRNAGRPAEQATSAQAKTVRAPVAKSPGQSMAGKPAQRAARPPAESALLPPADSALAVSPTAEELATRAARVEQEANHDLRRLVKLLDLNEEQQDRVFQSLAERSPSWSPSLQVASTTGVAMAGKRSAETYSTGTVGGAPTIPSAGVKTPAASDNTLAAGLTTSLTDSMSEILALLDPGQQDALVKAEMDRAAWWAEILPQITPSDDIPALDATPPAAGETKAYEGADVLE